MVNQSTVIIIVIVLVVLVCAGFLLGSPSQQTVPVDQKTPSRTTVPNTPSYSPAATGTVTPAITGTAPSLQSTTGVTARTTAPVTNTIATTQSQAYPTGSGVNIDITYNDIRPSPLIITSGTTVIWTNKDTKDRSITSDASAPVAFQSGTIAPGSNYQFTFTKTGTYKYGSFIGTLRYGGQITVK